MESNYMEWMEKTLESERAEWSGQRAPEVEPHSNAYHTHAPVIIFQMIDQNLQVNNNCIFFNIKPVDKKLLFYECEIVNEFNCNAFSGD